MGPYSFNKFITTSRRIREENSRKANLVLQKDINDPPPNHPVRQSSCVACYAPGTFSLELLLSSKSHVAIKMKMHHAFHLWFLCNTSKNPLLLRCGSTKSLMCRPFATECTFFIHVLYPMLLWFDTCLHGTGNLSI